MQVIKQYGHFRSGTNYLRALLLHNFDGVAVLSNALGHKHYPPANWRNWCDVHAGDGLDQFDAIRAAVEANEVLTVVSVKDPFGLADSWLRYKQLRWGIKKANLFRVVAEWCDVTNILYEHWAELVRRRGDRATFIRYEDLLADPLRYLGGLAVRWPLNSARYPFQDIPGRIEKGDRKTDKPHNREYWLHRRYLQRIPLWARKLIAARIDWKTFARLGYSPEFNE